MTGLKLERALRAGSTLRAIAQRINRRSPAVEPATQAGPKRRLRTIHLSVLDGRTLNLGVELPTELGRRPIRLELVKDETVVSVPMSVVHSEYGPTRAEAVAQLSSGPEGGGTPAGTDRIRLEPGRWRLRVALSGPVGQVERADVGAAEELLTEGPTKADPACPDTATQIAVDSTKDGRALLRVSRLAASAEVSRVRLGWTGISVSGRPVALTAADRPLVRAEAVRRDTGGAEQIPVSWDGDRFAFDLPLDRMTATGDDERIWDLRLRCGERVLKLGRRLTDVKDPKGVFRTPYRVVVTESGRAVRAHIYYTQGGNLCLSCVPLGTG